LSTGLASAFLIYLWVADELSVDKFHENDDRLFQVMVNSHLPDGIKTIDGTSGLLGETMADEFPEVEYTTVFAPPSWFQKFTISADNNNVNSMGNFVGRDYFNVFSYELIQGNKDKVLTDKNSIVLSADLAMKLFSTENVLGKTIDWAWFGFKRQCVVTGVYKRPPPNATDQFDFVVSFEIWKDILRESSGTNLSESSDGPFHTFLVLKNGTDFNLFNMKLAGFIKKRYENTTSTLFLRRYSDGHLYGNYVNGVQHGGRIEHVKSISLIAILILIIACINFMNLSTARASRRIKEIGVKKVIGANRGILIFQYLGESMLMSFLSLALAILFVDVAISSFNEITQKNLALNFSTNVLLFLAGITLITGLIAGSYPALYLSGFNPVVALKGKLNGSVIDLWMRKGLVVFQFTLSIIFIVSVLVISRQIHLAQTKDPSFDKNNIVYFEMEGRVTKSKEAFLNEIKNIPGIINASSTQQKIIVPALFESTGIRWEGKNSDDKIRFTQMPVNYDLIETLGIKIKAGRTFSRSFKSDTSGVIFNETAINAMGLKDPIGKQVSIWGKNMKIVGIVHDFHFQSLHERIKPFFFRLVPDETMTIIARINAEDKIETINRLREFYKSYNPGFSPDLRFLDDDYQAQYAEEKQIGSLTKYFAGLAIIISCLGLFGLVTFDCERRVKEIGIRKVLGSTEFGIVYRLSGDFTKLILIAIFIALPVSYMIARQWLNNFAYQIPLEWWYFISAGVAAMFITWLTVGTQAVKAARANPATCLKDE
jgi:ABC-type antimicrobial peptide transport system permease subunit